MKKITRIGVGGPVGSGKTAIIEAVTPVLIRRGIKPLIITNDVVTTEDAKHVQRELDGILEAEKNWKASSPTAISSSSRAAATTSP